MEEKKGEGRMEGRERGRRGRLCMEEEGRRTKEEEGKGRGEERREGCQGRESY